mmetsp:Transcript_16320/g.49279  ORF Transcript_16320/g.49279 Transcript_16320/m.49279 type:complete len:202 (-) Transcript_16320:511-1116(-)
MRRQLRAPNAASGRTWPLRLSPDWYRLALMRERRSEQVVTRLISHSAVGARRAPHMLQQRAPGGGAGERGCVAYDDKQALGAGERHVQPPFVRNEAQASTRAAHGVRRAHGTEEDDLALTALEGVHGLHGGGLYRQLLPPQLLPQGVLLRPVGRQNANVSRHLPLVPLLRCLLQPRQQPHTESGLWPVPPGAVRVLGRGDL